MKLGSGLVVAALLAGTAAGQALDSRETVATRARPELDPQGVRLGAFLMQPALTAGYERNDNIFATKTNEVDDNILTVKPRVDVASGWSRHALGAGAEIDAARYDDNGTEDYDDWRIYADGRLDLRSGRLNGSASHADLHEDRTSPDDFQDGDRPAAPNEFTLDAFTLEWLYAPGRVSVRPGVAYESFRFDDNIGTDGDPIRNGDRDRSELRASLRPAYDVAEGYDVYIEAAGTTVDYDQATDNDGFQRSSDGYELLVGTVLDLGGRTFGEAYVGYRSWTYDDDRFEDIDGVDFGVDIKWNLSGLTTLSLLGGRTIESTTIEDAAGIEKTALGLTADHELLRNLILTLRVEAATEDFRGIDREDDILVAGAGAKYLLSRYFYAYVGIDHASRDESGTDAVEQDYDVNTIYLRLQGNL